jgi:hypothetical protein
VNGVRKAARPTPEKIRELLRIAGAEVGTLESGTNAGAITRYTGGKAGWPWCARFVSWCYRQAGMPLPGGDQWAVAAIKSTIRRLGQWRDPRDLQPGMACVLATRSHIELVSSPVHQDGKLTGFMTIGADTPAPGARHQGVGQRFRGLGGLEGGGFPVRI